MQIDWSQMWSCAAWTNGAHFVSGSNEIAFVHDRITKTWAIIIIIMQSRDGGAQETPEITHTHRGRHSGSKGRIGGRCAALRTSANYFGFVWSSSLCLFTQACLTQVLCNPVDNNLINVSVCKCKLPKLKMRPPCPLVVEKSAQVFMQSHRQISKFVKLISVTLSSSSSVYFQLNNCHYKYVSISPTTNCTRSQHFPLC